MVDASVLATALTDDEAHGKLARTALAGEELAAPAIVDLEVTSVIGKRLRAGLITEHRAALAMSDLIAIPIQRVPHVRLLPRIWELRHNVTPYDAAYVALAELLSATLLTSDIRLSNAPGIGCTVETVEPPPS
ncbi:MAG: type II toxin-antitoxin system VapC family toxin [Mycobacteriales bacterium]